ncbi:hypothetical protein GCM10010156_54870 [Planobispora rosea]|uniref:Uncharacterized protein n=2 Tax=Planobispora rosea TaxID=35762 RepID=A0A8J3S4R6_PLARO|nr:hypothetical protein GCM10010156_54870 [Planobispora rosea]GIH86775.1 hypothetical protein Pro02_51830 [Planobispora rosea]
MRNDQPCLRVTRTVGHRRMLVAYCADVTEVNRYVDLAELVPAEESSDEPVLGRTRV